MATNKISLESAFAEHSEDSLQMAREAWAIRPNAPAWNPGPSLGACVCMQAWNSITGRTCPVHGYSAPMQITC